MTQPQDITTLIDAYLDGAMTAEERSSFERRAETDAELRRQLDLQSRIEGRLRVLMDVPPYAPAPPATSTVAGRIGSRRLFAPHWIGIAAVLVLGLLGVWFLIGNPFGPARSEMAANVYLKRVADSGFKPFWVCKDDDEFRKTTREKLGVPFVVKPRAGVELVGWNYASNLLASSAQILLARVDGQPEMVVMGKREDDRRVYVEPSSGLKVHRKECSGLVFYEVNSRDDAPVIDGIQLPGCGD